MSEVKQYRKKPVVIEAVLWDGKIDTRNLLHEWCDGSTERVFLSHGEYEHPYIKTLEGEMMISPGDYVIKGVKGEFYPCKPDIFAATHDELAAPSPNTEQVDFMSLELPPLLPIPRKNC